MIPADLKDKDLLSIPEVCRALKVTRWTLWTWEKEGKLAFNLRPVIPGGLKKYALREEVERFLVDRYYPDVKRIPLRRVS